MRRKKVSPDGEAVAILLDDSVVGVPAGWWGVMHSRSAGGYASPAEVEDWPDWDGA